MNQFLPSSGLPWPKHVSPPPPEYATSMPKATLTVAPQRLAGVRRASMAETGTQQSPTLPEKEQYLLKGQVPRPVLGRAPVPMLRWMSPMVASDEVVTWAWRH